MSLSRTSSSWLGVFTSRVRNYVAEASVSLDAEIAKAQAALAELVSQRSEAQRLLESNSAPSESEAHAIREIIIEKEGLMEQLEAEIEEVQLNLESIMDSRAQAVDSRQSPGSLDKFDADIETSRSMLKSLRMQRDQTHITLETHRALLSPIRRLPSEVLSEIFLHCLPKDKFVQASVAACPLLLAQVSSDPPSTLPHL